MKPILLTSLIAGLATLSVQAQAQAQAQAADDRYGYWSKWWGKVPPPPPDIATEWRWRPSGWYHHVRECQLRYKTYNPYTDTYRIGPTHYRCRLKMPL